MSSEETEPPSLSLCSSLTLVGVLLQSRKTTSCQKDSIQEVEERNRQEVKAKQRWVIERFEEIPLAFCEKPYEVSTQAWLKLFGDVRDSSLYTAYMADALGSRRWRKHVYATS